MQGCLCGRHLWWAPVRLRSHTAPARRSLGHGSRHPRGGWASSACVEMPARANVDHVLVPSPALPFVLSPPDGRQSAQLSFTLLVPDLTQHGRSSSEEQQLSNPHSRSRMRRGARLASPPLLVRLLLLVYTLSVCLAKSANKLRPKGAPSRHAASLELHMLTDYPSSAAYPDAVCNDGTPGACARVWYLFQQRWRGADTRNRAVPPHPPQHRRLLVRSCQRPGEGPPVGGVPPGRRRVRGPRAPHRQLAAVSSPLLACPGATTPAPAPAGRPRRRS